MGGLGIGTHPQVSTTRFRVESTTESRMGSYTGQVLTTAISLFPPGPSLGHSVLPRRSSASARRRAVKGPQQRGCLLLEPRLVLNQIRDFRESPPNPRPKDGDKKDKELGDALLFSKETTCALESTWDPCLPLLGPVPLNPDLCAASGRPRLRLPRPPFSRLA